MHQTYVFAFLAIIRRALRSFVFLSVSTQTMYIHPTVFHSIWWTWWNLSSYLTVLDLHQRSSNFQFFFDITSNVVSVVLVTSMYFSRIGMDSSDSGFHVMTVNEITWDKPKIIFDFTMYHDESCREVEEDPLILLEDYVVLLLCLGCPGLRWMFSDFDLLQGVLTVPSATGNTNFSFFMGANTSLALSLLAWISNTFICSNSSMSAIIMSPFQILPANKA